MNNDYEFFKANDPFMNQEPLIKQIELKFYNVDKKDYSVTGRPYLVTVTYFKDNYVRSGNSYFSTLSEMEKQFIVISNSPGEAMEAFNKAKETNMVFWRISSIRAELLDTIVDKKRHIGY